MNQPSLRPTAGSRIIFGQGETGIELNGGSPSLRLSLPLLAGISELPAAPAGTAVSERAGFHILDAGTTVTGFAVAGASAGLEAATADLYRRLFAATEGLHLYRVWNYVPQINAVSRGLENYQRFSRQRSLVFEERFGADYRKFLPSASGVGLARGPLAVEFLAGRTTPAHWENPRQVPAFEYPREYGPRAPSFSRATSVAIGSRRRVFISGTAAVLGHASVSPDSLPGQIECTLANLETIGTTVGVGADLGRAARADRSFRVYLRHPGDLAETRRLLERSLLGPEDAVTWLQADICRRELLVEIEAAVELPA